MKSDKIHKFNDEVIKPLNTPENVVWGMFDLAWELVINQPERDCAVVVVMEKNGRWSIGVADRNKKGYTPTMVVFADEVAKDYEFAQKLCHQFNEQLLELSKTEAFMIEASTLSFTGEVALDE